MKSLFSIRGYVNFVLKHNCDHNCVENIDFSTENPWRFFVCNSTFTIHHLPQSKNKMTKKNCLGIAQYELLIISANWYHINNIIYQYISTSQWMKINQRKKKVKKEQTLNFVNKIECDLRRYFIYTIEFIGDVSEICWKHSKTK